METKTAPSQIQVQDALISALERIGYGRASGMLKANARRRTVETLVGRGYSKGEAHRIMCDAWDIYNLNERAAGRA